MDSSATFSRQTSQSRDPISNTFNLSFHVRQECLFVITLGKCSSVSFCFVAHRFSPFCSLLLTTGLKRTRLKRDCNTIALPRSSTFLTVNARVLLFHWLAAFWLDISFWEGVTCLEIFRRRKLALVIRENPSSLNELMGYVESTAFLEIWPEYSLIDTEQKHVGEFLYFKYFSRGGL